MIDRTPNSFDKSQDANEVQIAEFKRVLAALVGVDIETVDEILTRAAQISLEIDMSAERVLRKFHEQLQAEQMPKPDPVELEAALSPDAPSYHHDQVLLGRALVEAEKCRDIQFYGVGCVITCPDGAHYCGHTGALTHEHNGQIKMRHAEEVAIMHAITDGRSLVGATLYTTLEPCSERLSGLPSCTSLIIKSGISRVVFGAHEPYDPELNITCRGARMLAEAGIEVVHLGKLEDQCLASIVSRRTGRK